MFFIRKHKKQRTKMLSTYSIKEAGCSSYARMKIDEINKTATLVRLFVPEENRGKGHAKTLMKRVLEDAKLFQYVVYANVDVDSIEQDQEHKCITDKEFYCFLKKHGFKKYGETYSICRQEKITVMNWIPSAT